MPVQDDNDDDNRKIVDRLRARILKNFRCRIVHAIQLDAFFFLHLH